MFCPISAMVQFGPVGFSGQFHSDDALFRTMRTSLLYAALFWRTHGLHVNVGRNFQTGVPQQFLDDFGVLPVGVQ